MGEEKGGGYSNVAAVNAWNKAYERSRRRTKLAETITEISVSDKINDAEWVKARLQKVLDDGLNKDIDYWDVKYDADN